MNPLGQLPPSTSASFSLDKTDLMKVFRYVLVLAAGWFLQEVPTLMGYSYTVNGHDYTPLVFMGVTGIAETARRFISGAKDNA